MTTNIKKCKFSNRSSGPARHCVSFKLFPSVARPSPCGGGGEFHHARSFYFRLLLQAACNDDGASNTRTSRSKWHLPALIVNDVVATESHFCELILGRYGLWCSSYCRPGSLTCRGDRARSRPVRIRPTTYWRRLVLDGPCLYSIYSRPIIYDSASMIKLKL